MLYFKWCIKMGIVASSLKGCDNVIAKVQETKILVVGFCLITGRPARMFFGGIIMIASQTRTRLDVSA